MNSRFSVLTDSNNEAAVLAENVSYRYPDGTVALQNVRFKIDQGEKVVFIGPNGSGKSTLLTLLNGVRQCQGLLSVLGYPVNKKNRNAVKSLVGLVFQNPDDQLFCPTIFEDVAFGPLNMSLSADEVKNSVSMALSEVGLEGFESRSSFHLSFGERKLASIATVLSMMPQIVAMDEPTSNLDLAHRRKIINWIRDSRQTIILTTHDLDMALETCQRVIVLNKGQIVADGFVEDILHNKDLLEANELELPLSLHSSYS